MAARTPIRSTTSSRSSDASSVSVPPSRAYEHAFGTPLSPRRAGISSPQTARASPQGELSGCHSYERASGVAYFCPYRCTDNGCNAHNDAVKQRLAELRKAKLAALAAAASSASESNNNNNSSSSSSINIDGSVSPTNGEASQLDSDSIRRPSSRTSSLSLDASVSLARTPSPAASEVTIELGMRSLKEEVDKAKKSGTSYVVLLLIRREDR